MPHRFMVLYEVFEARFDEVLARWNHKVRGSIAPESMASIELLDHMPSFLRDVIAALRADVGQVTLEAQRTAAGHGNQRLRLGFSLDAVVREYGALRDAIVGTATDAGVALTVRETNVISRSVIDGIAMAVSEYAHQRDAELHRQHNEHIAFLAHELRNPLATAVAAVAVIERPNPANAVPSPRAIAALGRSLTIMQELVDHSLRVARVATGIELRREHVTLRHLIDEATLLAEPDAERAGVELQSSVESDADLEIDVRLVRSALGNLVRNAIKYSKADGHVEVRATTNSERVMIEIEDCCGGLPDGKVEQAFAPFVRMTGEKDGFGLGLAIAKQAVDAHGGTIRVQNLPGKGCIFVLELPRL